MNTEPNEVLQAARAKAKSLMNQKDEIERELKEIEDFLKEQGMGFKGGLVDEQGFPLNDVGKVISVREARGKNSRLQNDHKDVMKQIELVLVEVAEASKNVKSSSTPVVHHTHQNPPQNQEDLSEYKDHQPFAKVNEVSPSSPAAWATLRSGDLILHFGSVNHGNHNGLKALSEVVRDSENRSLRVIVKRTDPTGTNIKALNLTPKKWEGRGLLGCHIVPLI